MSMIVHHFSLVLEKVALANPPLEINKKKSGRLGTKFLPIDRTGTQSKAPGTTILGRLRSGGSGGGVGSGTAKSSGGSWGLNVVTGLREKTTAPPVDTSNKGGKDLVTGGYLTEAGNAEVPGVFGNPNQGLTPKDPKWDFMAASPGYKQTQLPGGGVRTENRNIVQIDQPTGPARSWEYAARMGTPSGQGLMTSTVSGPSPGAERVMTNISPTKVYPVSTATTPMVSRSKSGAAANTYNPRTRQRTYHGGGLKPGTL